MERLDILAELLADVPRAPDVSIRAIATQTAAMVASDLVNLVSLVQSISLKRVMSSSYVPVSLPCCWVVDQCVSAMTSQLPNKISLRQV